jgi:hypothetical protein
VTDDPSARGGSIRVDPYAVLPAWSCQGTPVQIGVFCHELGHALGLPDLYDTDGSSEGAGGWGLMGAGGYGGNQVQPDRPSHLSAWSKLHLGLRTARTVLLEGIYALTPVEEGGEILLIETSDPMEYFLVEYRARRGFDDSLAGQGILVWHVDALQVSAGLAENTVNADETHYGVSLEQADGEFELESGGNRGDSGDPFPGFRGAMNPNHRFGEDTIPASSTFGGPSGVTIELVDLSGGRALLRIVPPEGDPDGDGVSDRSDLCPLVPDPSQLDRDGDGVGDACDNCRETPNPPVEIPPLDRTTTGRQLDGDADGIGDACDADFTLEGSVVNVTDLLRMLDAFGRFVDAWSCPAPDGIPAGPCAPYDLDGVGEVVNTGDLLELLGRIGSDVSTERCPFCPLDCEGPACP